MRLRVVGYFVAGALHSAFAGVVSGQGQVQPAWEHCHEVAQVARAGTQVDGGVCEFLGNAAAAVAFNAVACGGGRHQLHQPYRAFGRDGLRVKTRLRSNQGLQQFRLKPVHLSRFFEQVLYSLVTRRLREVVHQARLRRADRSRLRPRLLGSLRRVRRAAADFQHAAALNKQFVALVKPGIGEMRDATLVDISPDLRLRSAGPQQPGERRCKQRGHSQGLHGL